MRIFNTRFESDRFSSSAISFKRFLVSSSSSFPGNKKAAHLGSLVSFDLDLSSSLVISRWPDCPNTLMSPANNNEDQQDNQKENK